MIKLYIARHGETDLNINKVYYGWLDPPLNKNGVAQCEKLRDNLLNISFDEVFASPLRRAISTAVIVSGHSYEKIKKLEELKEINFGLWEGLHYSYIEKIYSKQWEAWSLDWQNYTIPEGESFKEFYCRVRAGLDKILRDYENRTILLIAHEGVLKVIATLILNMKIEDYWKFSFEFGKYSLFEITEGNVILRKINC